jgi:hypothetical protein
MGGFTVRSITLAIAVVLTDIWPLEAAFKLSRRFLDRAHRPSAKMGHLQYWRHSLCEWHTYWGQVRSAACLAGAEQILTQLRTISDPGNPIQTRIIENRHSRLDYLRRATEAGSKLHEDGKRGGVAQSAFEHPSMRQLLSRFSEENRSKVDKMIGLWRHEIESGDAENGDANRAHA